MKYSLFTKRVENIQEEIEKEWLTIGTNMSLDSINSILDSLTENDYMDDYIYTILPDVGEGDIVLNMKTEEIATVIQFDYPKSSARFVVVKTDNGEILTWNIKNLMVI